MREHTALRLASWIYGSLLRLYPRGFREDFSEEMLEVFEQTAAEAADRGALALGHFLLRELRDLPFYAFWETRQHSDSAPAKAPASQPAGGLSRPESLVALAVFLIPAGLILLNTAPPSLAARAIPPGILGLLFIGSLTGLIKRFPRWSLPYLGLVFSAIIFLFLFQWEAERIATELASRFVVQSSDELGLLLLITFWKGVVWLSLLMLVSFVVLLLALFSPFRPLIHRLQEDWTQLSYLLYGGAMLALVLTFDEYRTQTPYALAALLCLAAGGYGYLRSSRPRRGFLALVTGATLAMWIAALGVWLLAPQDWLALLHGQLPDSERFYAAEQALIGWIWMLVVLALPGLLKLLYRGRQPVTMQ